MLDNMSNNKQSMKLYTEEQVNKIALQVKDLGYWNHLEITPIQLPSDEDTSHLQWMYDRMSNIHGENENYDYMLKFKEIIEQLKKRGNK